MHGGQNVSGEFAETLQVRILSALQRALARGEVW